jgi:hypothetical protein
VFTPQERAQLRTELLDRAVRDTRIPSAAITGSAAGGSEDQWSDIDLAFAVGDASQTEAVLADWSSHMYGRYQAAHHVDVRAGSWIYRVFLLPNTLQVDLAFVPAADFRAMAATFQLVFGSANEPRSFPAAAVEVIGMGWLYALHARSCIVRGECWRAEYMISGLRDHVLALACLRCGLPVAHGRGMDRLPADVTTALEGALVRDLNTADLLRAFGVAIDGLLAEVRLADASLSARLEAPLKQLLETAGA